MTRVRLDATARADMRDIYRYSVKQWGRAQADAYIGALSAKFDAIADGRVFARAIPGVFGVHGFFCTCESHFIYWRRLGTDAVAIVAILHHKMHQPKRIRTVFRSSIGEE